MVTLMSKEFLREEIEMEEDMDEDEGWGDFAEAPEPEPEITESFAEVSENFI